MRRIKVMTIFGTRPEANKMCPLVLKLKENENIDEITVVTAQHREMLDQSLSAFGVEPHFDLDIMQKSQTLTDITVKALTGLEELIQKTKPDLVLVHGDTTTSFAGALAAFYQKVKIGHVEAGLRTYNKYEPYPEEINRKLTGAVADFHFSPTGLSKNNLLREGVDPKDIYITGNTAIDGLKTTIDKNHIFSQEILNKIDFNRKRIISMTAHRRENLGKPLRDICNAVNKITKEFDDVEVVYAVHPNPVVMETANEILSNNPRVHLIEPLNIKDMHNLMDRSYFVMSDSGGLQEEAPSMGKPVLVLRNVTERPEGIEAGTLKLAGTESESVYEHAKRLLTDSSEYKKMSKAKNPFGDGFASERILQVILYSFGFLQERPKDFE